MVIEPARSDHKTGNGPGGEKVLLEIITFPPPNFAVLFRLGYRLSFRKKRLLFP